MTAKASTRRRAGLLPAFTGISDLYEVPAEADLTINTAQTTVENASQQVLAVAAARG